MPRQDAAATVPDELRIAREDLFFTLAEVGCHLARAEELLAGLARRRAALGRLLAPDTRHPTPEKGAAPAPDAAAGAPRLVDGGGRVPPIGPVPIAGPRAPAAAEGGNS